MGATASGKEYRILDGIEEVKAQYHRIQLALAMVDVGNNTDTRKLLHQTNLISPVISNYIYKFKCVTVTQDAGERFKSGDTPSLVTRDSLPNSSICPDCTRSTNCILWLIVNGGLDINFVPEAIRRSMIIS